MVSGKHGMEALMIALKEAEIKSEAIQLHLQQVHIETQHLKDKNETPTLMVHAGNINKTTAIPLPTNEEWRQATSEDNDIGYIQGILSIPEETPIDPKELRKNGYVKPFQKGRLEL